MSSKSAALKETGMNWLSREVAERRVVGGWGVTKIYQDLFSLLVVTSKKGQ